MNDSMIIDQQAADVSHVEPDVPRSLAVEPADPFALLVRAVDKGMDPAQLKALVDLQEQWRAARAKEAFSLAMNACQAEMPCIVRDAHNKQTDSNYIRLETVTHQAKPIYTRHGFSLSFPEAESNKPPMANGQPWKRIVCLVRHSQGCTEEHWIDLPCDGIGPKGSPIGGMNAVQGAVSTGSYGQRVLTCRVFNITIADTDLDGNRRDAYENPEPDHDAPRAAPRGQRNDAQATVEAVKRISAKWKDKHPNVYGAEPAGIAAWSTDYKRWVMNTCDRVFNPQKPDQWTTADIGICERALGITNQEAQ